MTEKNDNQHDEQTKFSIMTLRKMTFSITKFSIMTLSVMKFSVMTYLHNEIQYNGTLHTDTQ